VETRIERSCDALVRCQLDRRGCGRERSSLGVGQRDHVGLESGAHQLIEPLRRTLHAFDLRRIVDRVSLAVTDQRRYLVQRLGDLHGHLPGRLWLG
jgi:hypothetical protein